MSEYMRFLRFKKSCDGIIILYLKSGKYSISANQIINYKKFEKVGTEYHNVFLNEIIQNVQIYGKNDDNIYYGRIDLPSRIICKNITPKSQIKIHYLMLKLADDKPSVERFRKRQELLREQNNICLATLETYKGSRKHRLYWEKLVNEVDDHFFYEDTDNYRIIPEQPFSQTIIKWFEKINDRSITNRKEALRELLYDVRFQYYYKLIYISDLFKKDFDTTILEDAIVHIKYFYLDKFGYQVKSDFELYITLNQIKEDSDQLVFDFMLIEPALGNKYISFINILLKPRINDLINRVKRKNFYLYTNVQHTSSKDCLESYVKKDSMPKSRDSMPKSKPKPTDYVLPKSNYYVPKLKDYVPLSKNNSYYTLFQMEKQGIKIINAYNSPNKHHTYCAKFFLIQIGIKYFEISIKIITYEILIRDKSFFGEFEKSLMSNFQNKEYFETVLPAHIEIYVKSVDPNIYEIPVSMYYIDTAKMYRETLLPIIVKTPIDLKLLLVQLWFRTLINLTPQSSNPVDTQKSYLFNLHDHPISLTEHYFQLFTNKLLENPYIAYFLLMDVENTTNFVKILKEKKNIGKVLEYIYTLKSLGEMEINERKEEIQAEIDKLEHSKFRIVSSSDLFKQFVKYVNSLSYTIWYVSEKIYITNYRILLVFLDSLDSHKWGDKDVAEIEISNRFTNFYTIYSQGDFVHSIRQLTKDLKNEIRKFKISSSYHLGVHYPGNFRYQILHLNVYNSTTDSFVDVVGNQYNIHSERYISQYDIFNTDYTDADISVSRQLILRFKDFVNIDSKKISIETIIEKLNDKYSPQHYLPNIREILINSGVNLV